MAVSSPEEMMELSLIENIQRDDLNPIHEARAYLRLQEECHLTQEEVATRVGKNRTTVANTLRLLKLPAEVQKCLLADEITMGHARALLGTRKPRGTGRVVQAGRQEGPVGAQGGRAGQETLRGEAGEAPRRASPTTSRPPSPSCSAYSGRR